MSARTILASLTLCGVAALGGCSAKEMYLGGTSTERTGVSSYAGSTLTTTDRVPVGRAFLATKAACDDMGFLIVGEESESFDARVTARDNEDRKITMWLTADTENTTTVAIRVKGGERALRKDLTVATLKAIRSHY